MRYLAVLLAMAAAAGVPLDVSRVHVVETTVPLVQKRSSQPWTSRRSVPTTTTTVAPTTTTALQPITTTTHLHPTTTTTAHVHRAKAARRPRIADVWTALARCESGGWWDIEGAHSGGLQFAGSTWRAFGGLQFAPTAGRATPAQQIAIATKVQAAQGWKAWPSCSRQLGLR